MHLEVQGFSEPYGADVLAAADGEIQFVYKRTLGCGKGLVIRHRFEREIKVGDVSIPWEPTSYTVYCHMSEVTPKVAGEKVDRGEVIGKVGTTGSSAGIPHLHFEFCLGYKCGSTEAVDPLDYTVGCFNPNFSYPTERLVLTYPVACKNQSDKNPAEVKVKLWPPETP